MKQCRELNERPRYNKADHPIAFHKGDMFAASKKKVAPEGAAPDNEDVFEVCFGPGMEKRLPN